MSGIRRPPTPPSRELPPPPPPGTPPLPQPPTPPVEPEGPCDPLPRTKSKLSERAAQRVNNREKYSTVSRSPRAVPQRVDDGEKRSAGAHRVDSERRVMEWSAAMAKKSMNYNGTMESSAAIERRLTNSNMPVGSTVAM